MSDPVSSLGKVPIPQKSTDEEAASHKVKHQLQDCANELQSAIAQINSSKDINHPVPQDVLKKLDYVSGKIDSLIHQLSNIQAAHALSNAVRQIQQIVRDPESHMDPSGQIKQAYITISEVIQE